MTNLRLSDILWLVLLLVLIALPQAQGLKPVPPKLTRLVAPRVCFLVRDDCIGCFGPSEEVDIMVDGRPDPPFLIATLFSMHGRYYTVTLSLRREEYVELLRQVEKDGLWQQPSRFPQYGLAWVIAGDAPLLRSSPDDLKLSQNFFQQPLIANLRERLRADAASERRPPPR